MQENKQPTDSSRHRPFYKLPLFWVILVVLIVAGILIVPRVLAKPASTSDQPTTTTSSSTSTSSSKNTQSTEQPSTKPDTTTSDSGDKTPTQYDGEDPNTGASLTGSLTTARFSGDKLIVRVNIDQYLSSGTCALTISSGSNQLVKTANLIPSAATSTCEGFDISSSELSGFNRPLSVTIDLTSGDKTGIIEGKVE